MHYKHFVTILNFVENPNKQHAKEVVERLRVENMRSIANNQTKMIEIDEQGMITMKSSEPQGSFRTPGFGDSEYKGEFYNRTRNLHYILDLVNIRELIGEGTLVINVQTQGSWSYSWQGPRLQLYERELNMSDAESFCVRMGGHLPSILSREEQEEMRKVSNGSYGVWVGGIKKADGSGWEWLDGRKWGFQKWDSVGARNCSACDCVTDSSGIGIGWGWFRSLVGRDEENRWVWLGVVRRQEMGIPKLGSILYHKLFGL